MSETFVAESILTYARIPVCDLSTTGKLNLKTVEVSAVSPFEFALFDYKSGISIGEYRFPVALVPVIYNFRKPRTVSRDDFLGFRK